MLYSEMCAKDRRDLVLKVLTSTVWCTTAYLAKKLRATSSLNLLRLDVFRLKKAGKIEVANINHTAPHIITGYLRQKRTKLIAVRLVTLKVA